MVRDLTVIDAAGQVVVDGVSFEVHAGEILAIAGVQGNGQTELTEAILGLQPRVSGTIDLDGTRLTGRSVRRVLDAGVGFVPEDRNEDGLVAEFTIAENLMLGRHHLTKAGFLASGLRLPSATREGRRHGERVREIADFLELGDKLHTPVGVLSYGDQKRVEVARALSADPRTTVVFMTANAKRIPPDFAGAFGVIAKPYSERAVASALHYVCECRAGRSPSAEGLDGFRLASMGDVESIETGADGKS